MKDRLILLFLPFVLALIAMTVGYTFLHWLLFIELELLQVDTVITEFGIPFVLTAIIAWLVMRPRFRILDLKTRRGSNWRDFYSVAMWLALAAPTIIAQEYMVTATGKISGLDAISEIASVKKSRYYTVKTFHIDRTSLSMHSEFSVSGRYNDRFNMNIYMVLPIFDSVQQVGRVEPFAWLGIRFHESVSNRLEPSKKESEYEGFERQCLWKFERKNLYQFEYLDRLAHSEQRNGYLEAVRNNAAYRSGEIVLEAVNEPYEQRSGDSFEWIFRCILIGSGIWLLLILIPSLDRLQLNRVKQGRPDTRSQQALHEFMMLLKLNRQIIVTQLLLYANVGMYVLMMVMGLGFVDFKAQDLLHWGGNYGPLTLTGEWWRLFTHMFLHGGLVHLIFNSVGLMFLGMFLEPLLGRSRFIASYVVTGLLAGISSVLWHESTVSVGASGAIFGLCGVLMALLMRRAVKSEYSKSFLGSVALFVGFNLFMGLMGGIDNAAHIGGLLSGILLGLLIYPTLSTKELEQRL